MASKIFYSFILILVWSCGKDIENATPPSKLLGTYYSLSDIKPHIVYEPRIPINPGTTFQSDQETLERFSAELWEFKVKEKLIRLQ